MASSMRYAPRMIQLSATAKAAICGGFVLCLSLGCTLSREVQITSEPSGARVWLGNQPIGQTPIVVRAKATGSAGIYTFDPQYVTLSAVGFREEVRPLDYEWSRKNLLLSFPFIAPGVLWGRLPTDLHVELQPESE
jgi:hypothetical protein